VDVRSLGTNSGVTEVHIVNGINATQFLVHLATALPEVSPASWSFTLGDFNRDGRLDLYAVNLHDARANRTAVHVLNGRNLAAYLAHFVTALAPANPAAATFRVG
jgi:hypothetical protein